MRALQQNYQLLNNTENDPTHEYFNMGVFNEYSSFNTEPKQLRFNQTKQFSIVDKADDYFLSIIRWNLTSNLPVIVPDIQIKQEPEKFTNLTDYELSLLYTSETTDIIPNTFGLLSANGKNYNGEFSQGAYGNLKTYNINFQPDNSNSVGYDNYNNGLLSNGSINGSVYIVSNGVLKVFDKVSNTNIFTLSPAVGESYKFVCVDITTGDFYIGLTQTANNSITYNQYTRTGSTTWALGNSYTSYSNKNNVNGICLVGNNLYEFSSSQSLPDTLYGTKSQKVYNVEQGTQLTTGNIMSPLVQIGSIYGFAIGTDSYTYAVNTPFINPPNSYFNVNNTTLMRAGCILSDIISGNLYGINNINEYNVWNLNCGFNPPSLPNSWTSVGDIALGGGLNPLNIDRQNSTKKLFVVGSDNNLYTSTYPVAPVEILFNNLMTQYDYGITLGVDFWNSQGNQDNYLIRQTNTFGGNVYGIFKNGGNYFVAQGGSLDLNIYSQIDYSLINSYPSLDNNLQNFTYLPINALFAYANNNNEIVVRSCANPAVVLHTITGIANVGGIYQLDSQHIAVCTNGFSPSVFIYNYTTNTLVLTITTPSNVADLCVNVNEVVNGVPTLYVVVNSNMFQLGTEILKYTFTNSSYGGYNAPVTIYTTSNNELISFIDCHQTINALVFITGILSSNVFQNVNIRTLYSYSSYALNGMTSSLFNYAQGTYLYPQKIQGTYLNQTLSSTHCWTQMTTGTTIKAVNVSRSDENNLYALGSGDSLLYSGTINGLNCPLSRIGYITNTYDYISSVSLISPYYENIITEWSSAGVPSNSNIFDENQIQSTSYNRSSLFSNGTNIYALYENLNNQTKLNLLNPTTLVSLSSSILSNKILNGLIGLDENNNILISTLQNSIAYLAGFNPLTLASIYNNQDPIIEYSTSSLLLFPYLKTKQTTHYNMAGDGCVNLIFIPETVNTSYDTNLLYPQSKEQLFSNPYFYIKYVDTLCRMINNAIADSLNSITGASWAHLPYFIWDSVAGKLVYNQPLSTPTGTPAPQGAKWFVAVNQPLFNLLNTFRFKFFPTNAGNSAIYPEDIDCRYLLDTNILYSGTTQPSGEYETYVQQISSVQTWSPIQSLVFISSLLPTEPQMTGIPSNISNNPTTTSAAVAQTNLSKVLTDFIIPLTSGVELTNQIVDFSNSGEYRLVDLIGGQSLNQISLEVYWKDKYGFLHPVYIDAGTNADLLCMLRKKSYNSKI